VNNGLDDFRVHKGIPSCDDLNKLKSFYAGEADNIEKIKYGLNNIYDMVRGYSGRQASDYIFILLLLLLKRRSYFGPDASNEWENIVTLCKTSNNKEIIIHELDSTELLRWVIDERTVALNSFRKCPYDNQLSEIILFLDSYDISPYAMSDAMFGSFFSFLIFDIHKRIGSLEKITDRMYQQLLTQLPDYSYYNNVFDMAAGVGNTVTSISRYQDLLGYSNESYTMSEINTEAAIFCELNMIANNVNNPDIFTQDTLTNIPSALLHGKYDYVISDIPIGLRLYRKFDADFMIGPPPERCGTAAFIQSALHCLKDDGMAYLTVEPTIFTTAGYNHELTKFLVDLDLIDTIVSLPSRTLTNTQIAPLLLVLTNSKPHERQGKVLLIDHYEHNNDGLSPLSVLKIISCVQDRQEIAGYSKVVDIEDIESNDYQINIKYLLSDKIIDLKNNPNAKSLSSICNVITGVNAKSSSDGKYPYVTIKDLKKNVIDQYLDCDSCEKYTNENKKIISDKCILVSLIGEFKPTIHKGEKSIVISNNIIALQLNDNGVDFEFLYFELYSEYIQNQINCFSGGSTMPRLNKKAFDNIYILIPAMDRQIVEVKTKKNDLFKIENERFKNIREKLELEQSVSEAENIIIGTMSHSLKTPLGAIELYTEVLKDFFNNNTLMDKQINEDDASVTVASVIAKIEKNNKRMQDIIGSTKKSFQTFEKDDFEYVNLNNLIQDIMSLYSSTRFELKCEDDLFVKVHRPAFKDLIIQLIENSIAHAFVNVSPNDVIKIDIKYHPSQGLLLIKYSNTGKPFQITKEEFIAYSKKGRNSQGEGIGGFYINKIIRQHDGDFEIRPKTNGTDIIIKLNLEATNGKEN
ncbi:MAG: N-6 DNA methylase, partial [Gudongella sp.]|nr:N-6 DNA methylase [Gudongella sp.]